MFSIFHESAIFTIWIFPFGGKAIIQTNSAFPSWKEASSFLHFGACFAWFCLIFSGLGLLQYSKQVYELAVILPSHLSDKHTQMFER